MNSVLGWLAIYAEEVVSVPAITRWHMHLQVARGKVGSCLGWRLYNHCQTNAGGGVIKGMYVRTAGPYAD